jgi:hypothetical protein
VAVLSAVTAVVVTLNVADVAPAATVTVEETAAAESLLESPTTDPPAGAGPVRETVPVELLPPTTLVGETLTDESEMAGITASETAVE